ncbi:hypothetical protein T492DRAFT_1021922 [Pavlovales sp. CCMP2436]|nr:hypothetical protein T492DRAFT_1021922 [Pavlovales sp. CCMP2436]
MNWAATGRYRTECERAATLNAANEKLMARHAALQPLLMQVRDIEVHVADLERTVLSLNEYTKRLEHRYRALA